ncbi:MAG: EVE domain-containing protein [Bacteroidota bacterium]
MKRFLLKSEPSEYSFDDLIRDTTTVWSGVRNATALIHMRTMRKGDEAFLYHTGNEKQIVGIVQITADPYPDPAQKNDKLVAVEIRPLRKLDHPVPLTVIKNKKEFSSFPLVTISRLSVMPVSETEWNSILVLSKKAQQ